MPTRTAGRPSMRSTPYLRRLYWIWNQMQRRCADPEHKQFADYGGRGITVCDRWRDSFWNFHDDMHPRPDGGLLDRRENDGPYSPENCRWTDRKTQNSNRRNCIYLDDGGERVTLREYARRHDLTYRATLKRLRRGWTLDQAVGREARP